MTLAVLLVVSALVCAANATRKAAAVNQFATLCHKIVFFDCQVVTIACAALSHPTHASQNISHTHVQTYAPLVQIQRFCRRGCWALRSGMQAWLRLKTRIRRRGRRVAQARSCTWWSTRRRCKFAICRGLAHTPNRRAHSRSFNRFCFRFFLSPVSTDLWCT